MNYKTYQHVERLGNIEVDGILDGKCYIFPKIDGTNGTVFMQDGVIQTGSRRRHLTEDQKDNQGFRDHIQNNQGIIGFMNKHPNLRLFGEWLVPHSLKTYRDDAWRKFYIFDVMDENDNYLAYPDYQPLLEEFNLEYLAPLLIVNNPDEVTVQNMIKANRVLIKEESGTGEGIVIKNYEYKNKYGRVTWAKVVTQEFKEKHSKVMGVNEITKMPMEQKFINDCLTESLVNKEFAKIENETGGWTSKCIPMLLGRVFHCLVTEELWNFIKKNKYPKIDFKRLNNLTIIRIKQVKSNLF